MEGALQFAGMSPNNYNTQTNSGLVFFALKPFADRADPASAANAMAMRLGAKMGGIQEAFVGVFPPPPIQGLGSMGGFKLNVEDRGSAGSQALYEAVQQVIAKAATNPALAGVYSTYQVNVPQVRVEVDRVKVKQQGVELTDVFQTLQASMGSAYVNDFNRFGRTYRVMVQADAQFRNEQADILALKVRNATGDMVPLGSLVTLHQSYGPDFVERFNAYRSADITGGAAPGHSSGEAQAAIAQILKDTLPQGMSFEWTELAYQQQSASGTALLIFPLCVLFVFLVLAAQYESFKLPLAIVLIVPLALLAGLAGVYIQGGDSKRLHADRLPRTGGARVQERDPHRRVRQAPAGGPGSGPGECRARGREAAAAPDPDDVDSVHRRRGAAGAGARRGRRGASGHGRGGIRRHDRRDDLRVVPYPGVLRAAAA